jgi:hypothetical protein
VTTRKTTIPDQRNAPARQRTPTEVYENCMREERRIEAIPHKERVREIAEHLLFLRPFFEAAFLAGDEEFQEISRQSYPFDYSIAQHVESRVSPVEWRYGRLLQHLRKQQDTELRWLLIARWLKQEGVCEPRQFLPNDMLRRLVRRYQKTLSLSPTDLKYWAIIQNWRPYFEGIRDALRARKSLNRARQEVEKLGYDPRAVGWVRHTRSVLEAIYGWLGKDKKGVSAKLRNAYSRRHGNRPKRCKQKSALN